MESGSFIGVTPCPAKLGSAPCNAIENVYLMASPPNSSGSYTSICSGALTPWGAPLGQHQQFFGSYYLSYVNTGSAPAF
jgi:hypothetical protein